MEINYRNFTNGTALMRRGYEAGDTLIAGRLGTVAAHDTLEVQVLAERIWTRHNRDDRPDGQLCPSMSVGDVVVIGESALTVESVGFSPCSIDPADVVTGLSWVEWIETPQANSLHYH